MAIIRSESGITLENWEVVVGDGLYVAPGEAPVGPSDITTINNTDVSVLKANIQNRRIMAHNITFYRIFDALAMTSTHEAIYEFKIPYDISTANTDFNGQTVEGGLFVWDGPDTRLDYGLAFQWVINPWAPDFEEFQYWTGSSWSTLGTLEASTDNHIVKFTLDIPNQLAYITLNGLQFSRNVFSSTTKPADWGTGVEARFQAEIISIFPSATGTIPKHKTRFHDWSWVWTDEPLTT